MAKEVVAANDGIDPINSVSVRASSQASARRIARNNADADRLEQEGYTVERGLHPNGAYFAMVGKHSAQEVEVGRIFAENGLAFTLDREGNVKVRIKGQLYILPSSDGHVEGFTHEIYSFDGKPKISRVVDAIEHSHKRFKPDYSYNLQSQVAISIAPKGSAYSRATIADGVREYKRKRTEGETSANPLMYFHVDESTRTVYWWNIK